MSGPLKTIDAVFERLGVDLIVDPDGAAQPVLHALPAGQSNDLVFNGREIRADGGDLRVRSVDLPHLPEGAVFEMLGERRAVKGAPAYVDRFRLVAELTSAAV